MSGPSDFWQPRAVMSDNSERESQSPPSPHAFSGEEFESGSHDEALGTDGESTKSDHIVEGLIMEGDRGEEEQLRSPGYLCDPRSHCQPGVGYNSGTRG
ncbi:unnamed protein product [Prunus armeniaca]|uniref:Uncharacterized protein n=1 Tax=Prunus armeniaca TaxID=36596 RepID=A0A6J5UGE5_PRUAR|nr:unnamed protein product [Prunus armeniaca]